LKLLTELVSMLIFNNDTKKNTYQWFQIVTSANFERTKMYFNNQIVSSSGFLFNITIVLLNILFELHNVDKTRNNYFKLIEQVEPLYCITSKPINFNQYDKINPDIIKDFLNNFEIDMLNENEFNDTTELYFMIHVFLSYFIKTLYDEYSRAINNIGEMYKNNQNNDPKL